MEKKQSNFTYTPVKSDIFKDEAEYIEIMEAVKAELMTVFDNAIYKPDIYQGGLQHFMVEMGTPVDQAADPAKWYRNDYWCAMTSVFSEGCLAIYKAGKLKAALASKIDLLKYQMKQAIPNYYAVRFPEDQITDPD